MVVVSSTFSVPADGVLLQTSSIKLLINDQEVGTGTLYITEHNVIWGGGLTSTGSVAPTISLLYPTISLHAIQRDPSPALYMVLNYELRLPEMVQVGASGDASSDDDDDFDADNTPITQLRFVPAVEAELQAMYSAMSQGQALHPDPVDEDAYDDNAESEEGEDEFEDAEEPASPEEAAARLRQLRLEGANGNHQFDDDDEEEEVVE